MANIQLSGKRTQISKDTARMVTVIATASVITVFSLVASKSLLSQRSYQSRVINEKDKAKQQLVDNLEATKSLVTQYKAFVTTTQNIIGGNPNGGGERDGDNARIILDALPSKYDFPALVTSIEKVLTTGGYQIDAIAGTDDEVTQAENVSSTTPQPVEMPFQIAVTSSYDSVKGLIGILDRSIRPIHTNVLSFTGSEAEMQVSFTAHSFYQPSKSLNITTKEVR